MFDSAPIKNISRVKKSDYTLEELRCAAQALIELLTPIANGQPPGREEQAALEEGLNGFGLTPDEAWLVVVMREIERESRQMLWRSVARSESDDVERGAQRVVVRARDELGPEQCAHINAALVAGHSAHVCVS